MTQQYFDQNLKIFALNSNRPLAEKIAKHVGVDLGKLSVNRFSDGEIQINIEESVRGDNVYPEKLPALLFCNGQMVTTGPMPPNMKPPIYISSVCGANSPGWV